MKGNRRLSSSVRSIRRVHSSHYVMVLCRVGERTALGMKLKEPHLQCLCLPTEDLLRAIFLPFYNDITNTSEAHDLDPRGRGKMKRVHFTFILGRHSKWHPAESKIDFGVPIHVWTCKNIYQCSSKWMRCYQKCWTEWQIPKVLGKFKKQSPIKRTYVI